ncbi:MAG: ATP-grasp domain-containing protein [Candidatus Coatesbacteria bacterium]|nr:ATP-grasp domain-containing protein [Candidatus Coatesbacteria bacterium]
MYSILFTNVGKHCEIIQYFKSNGFRVTGTDIYQDNSIPASSCCDSYYRIPFYKDKSYAAAILDICLAEDVKLVFPLSHNDIFIIDEQRDIFRKSGVFLLLPERDILLKCMNLWERFIAFRHLSVPTPQTWLPSQISISKFDYPLYFKSIDSLSQYPNQIVKNARELNFFLSECKASVIQEIITGKEYVINILSDIRGRVVSLYPVNVNIRKTSNTRIFTLEKSNDIFRKISDIAVLFELTGPSSIKFIYNEENEKSYIISIKPGFDNSVLLTMKAGPFYAKAFKSFIKGWDILPNADDHNLNMSMFFYEKPFFYQNKNK